MKEIFDRLLLRQRRNIIAPHFSDHDFLHQEVANDFCARLGAITRSFPRALVLGAHHGALPRRLQAMENIDEIISTESSSIFLSQCPAPKILCDEDALPLKDQSFDLIAAPLSLHFINDLPGALIQIRRALKPDGLFLGTLYGHDTLYELRSALAMAEEELTGGIAPHIAPFIDVRECGSLLQRAGFALPVADLDRIDVSYKTPFHLMRELRAMGENNIMLARQKTPTKRAIFMRMAEIYFEQFGFENERAEQRIPASFDIVTLTAWAPHERQQQPLRPGSAKMRLADALHVEEKSPLDEPDEETERLTSERSSNIYSKDTKPD